MTEQANRTDHLETSCIFGHGQNLLGVLCQPKRPKPNSKVAVIMLTPGMLHHVGPFRQHVDLARSLARQGWPSLRFDLAGIGESLAIGNVGTSLDRATSEIAASIDYLHSELGIEQVVLYGLCSGADDGLYAAARDHRIRGMFLIDGCGYRTLKYYWYRLTQNYLPKAHRLDRWKKVLCSWRSPEKATPLPLQQGKDVREFPDRQTAACQIRDLAKRGVSIHFHYTGGVSEYYNYQNQFNEMFPGKPFPVGVTHTFWPHHDHVQLLCEHRQELIELATSKICDMLEQATATTTRLAGADNSRSQPIPTVAIAPSPASSSTPPYVQ